MQKKYLLILLCAAFFVSCFGAMPKQGSVVSYRAGVVRTVGGAFNIGSLPSTWEQQKIKYRAILFRNTETSASITVDSWCKDAFDDGSLESLSRQLFRGIGDLKIALQTQVALSGRQALKTEARGKIDGVPIFMSTYVLKMNACVFDFVYVASPDRKSDYTDFENMVQGFRYIEGPELL